MIIINMAIIIIYYYEINWFIYYLTVFNKLKIVLTLFKDRKINQTVQTVQTLNSYSVRLN